MPDVHPISMRPVFALTRSPLGSDIGIHETREQS